MDDADKRYDVGTKMGVRNTYIEVCTKAMESGEILLLSRVNIRYKGNRTNKAVKGKRNNVFEHEQTTLHVYSTRHVNSVL